MAIDRIIIDCLARPQNPGIVSYNGLDVAAYGIPFTISVLAELPFEAVPE
jgi:hypothetical protein